MEDDECSIFFPAHTDDVWRKAQYVYMHIQRVDGLIPKVFTYTFRRWMV